MPRTIRRRRGAIAVLLPLVVLAGACSGDDDTATGTVVSLPATTTASEATTTSTAPAAPVETTTSIAAETSSTIATTTTLPPVPRQPLTGMPLAEGEVPIPRQALAVKIDNATGGRRNHTGLAVADIVYEEIVEGSITRFAAVFHSQGADPVGPIRSGRSQDVDLLTPLVHPLFAWSGGNPGVERLIAESTLVDLNWQNGFDGYYRGPGSIPHNLYNDTQSLWDQTPPFLPGAPPEQFPYIRPGETFTGDPTAGLQVAMRGIDVQWDWDPATAKFVRSQEGRPHDDKTYGRIGATNVVVMVVEYLPSEIDARSPEAQTLGEGPLYVFSNGMVRKGRWSRINQTDTFTFVAEDGSTLGLTPGITWVELAEAVPSDDPANPGVALNILQPA